MLLVFPFFEKCINIIEPLSFNLKPVGKKQVQKGGETILNGAAGGRNGIIASDTGGNKTSSGATKKNKVNANLKRYIK